MRALLLLLSALILLETTDGVKYDELEEHDRKIADEAIKIANELGKDKHLDFSTILRPDGKVLNVILKSTKCEATSKRVHQKDCEILDKDAPQVVCVACHEKISCFLRKETDQIKAASNACLSEPKVKNHLNGGGSLLQNKGKPEGEIGCLGCI